MSEIYSIQTGKNKKKKKEIQNQVEEIAFYSIFSNSVCVLIDKNIV